MSDQDHDLAGTDERVLLSLPTSRDQEVTRGILATAGISSFPCANINEVCREAARGAGAAIVTEEAVLTGGFVPLSRYLKEQPAWSDLPVIVLTTAGEESTERTNALLRVGHVMLVKRPVDVSALVTTVQSAVRDRRRQYQVRELIAEHERQAAMIRMSEEKFRTLADNVQQIFWTCRADGQRDYLSRQGVEYTGIPEAQQLGLKWLRLVLHPDDQERTLAAWREAVEDRRTYDLEFRIRRFDGEYHWFKTRGTPIRDDQDKIVKWFGTCTDIEDQKQAEEALRDADRKKDEFLAMLAHELRNPLAAIGNAAYILGSRDAQAHFPWVKDVISRQVKQLGRLIDDLLDVSRITRGKIELRRENLDVSRVLNQAIESVRPLIEQRNHRLTVAYAPEPLRIEADPTRLEQIVVNLLTNAAKYTHPGGQISLTAEREGSAVVIRVLDNGIGIPSEKLPSMFELFTQGDRSLARTEGGLGIGLTLVKRLAELHGASVTGKSRGPDTGSEFAVSFPAAETAQPPRRKHRDIVAGTANHAAHILVVDDNRDTAWALSKLLEVLGHDVRTAHDGPSALALARRQRPDYVLLDIGLPGLDGYKVAAELRKDLDCRDTVIIAVSGYGQEEDRRRSQVAGFDHHLVKPINHDELILLLAEN